LAAGNDHCGGIRLDSGDLVDLSNQCREWYRKVDEFLGEETNLAKKMVIAASDGINEDKLKKYEERTHSMDVFGIGTNLITCQKTPALGMVCKLIEVEGSAR